MSDPCSQFTDPKQFNGCVAGNNAESMICANPRYKLDQTQCNTGVVAGLINFMNAPGDPGQKAQDSWCDANGTITSDGKKGCHGFVSMLYGFNKQ